MFLALRGVRPFGDDCLEHIIPKDRCERIYNIYDASDPIVSIRKVYATIYHVTLYKHVLVEIFYEYW